MDHKQAQSEAVAHMTDLVLGTDAKCKFKQASKHSPSRKRIPKPHLILKPKPFHFSSKLKPEKNTVCKKNKDFRSQERRKNKDF